MPKRATRFRWLAAAGVILAASTLSPEVAHARRGLVILGAGDTISHIADANLSSDPELAAQLSFESPAIGYKYEYFSIFFLDVWTGSGQLVLYDRETDRHLPLTDDEVRELTGRTSDSFGKPFLYRIPLGWFVIAALVGGFGFVWWRSWRQLP